MHNTPLTSTASIGQQMDTLLKHGQSVVHGPNSTTQFSEFSMESVIKELSSHAPDVYQLFCQLGNTGRNAKDGSTPAEERKAVMSLCTILNARSQMANGLQLLLTYMLIARATSKQVGTQ